MKAVLPGVFYRFSHQFRSFFVWSTVLLSSCNGNIEDAQAGSVLLQWTAPTHSTDGLVLEDLAGYRVRWGPESGHHEIVTSVNDADATSAMISSLSPGIYFFVVTAVDTSGNESTFSNEVEVVIQ